MINTSRSFNLKITPLSDIHVGTGNDIMPYDYVIKAGISIRLILLIYSDH